jgi:hypothetical protein
MTQPTPPIPCPFNEPSYNAGSIVIDKTGTVFQVWTGRYNGGAFGAYLFRTAKGGPIQLVWSMTNANAGVLIIMNKQLYIPFQPPGGGQMLQQISGYIDPSDTPSSQVVNVDESSLNAVKQSVTTAQAMASNAEGAASHAVDVANDALNTANNTAGAIAQIAALQAQVSALQNQINTLLTPNQVADLVWSKVWDANYQIRMGFLAGKSTIQQVQDYLNDLAVYIRNVVKK